MSTDSETESEFEPTEDRPVNVRSEIYDAIEEHADDRGHAPLGDVVDTVRSELPETARDVHDTLEKMEARGDIYPVENKVAITEDRR